MSGAPHDLGCGLAGTAVHRAVLARTTGHWEATHATFRALAAHPASADPSSTGLFRGAPAVAFALHTAAHPAYQPALDRLDTLLSNTVTTRLTAAQDRMAAGGTPRMREYDLISGLTGLAALLRVRNRAPHLLHDVLRHLVRLLLEPASIDGAEVPGWWTSDATNGHPDPAQPSGHGNLGLAHGVSGPIALLALTARDGHRVAGHHQALTEGCLLLARWARPTPTGGSFWPETISLTDLHGAAPESTRPGRPSWCYGTPGIARALQLAALATGDPTARQTAENALASCATDPAQLALLTDATVCHGWAGFCLTTDRAAADSAPGSRLRGIAPTLLTHLAGHPPPEAPGLLTGSDGTALTIHTLSHPHRVDPAWESSLLLN